MDSALIAALEAASPTEVLLVTITLSSATIRLTDGGFVVWSSQTYDVEDATYGSLGGVEAIEDGADSQATVCALTLLCDEAAMALLIEPEVQGSLVTVHLGAVNRSTGALIGAPDLLFRGELDQPRIAAGPSLSLAYDCITEEARMLEPNEEQRLTSSFHRQVWPLEEGYDFVIDIEERVYWRADDPNPAISR